MKAKTVMSCFTLLMALSMTAFLVEGIVAPLFKFSPTPVYRIFPLTSLPLVWVRFFSPDSAANPENPSPKKPSQGVPSRQITLLLTNGNEVSGNLVSEQDDWITLSIAGSHVGFHKSEIRKIRKED